jgi:hypothetical protein
MDWHEKILALDRLFPFFLLIYGFFVLLVLELPFFQRVLEAQSHSAFGTLKNRRALAWFSLVLGAFWSLQNLWADNSLYNSFMGL